MAKKKAGIIGGLGFIGQNLTLHLLEEGYEVVVISRKIDSSRYDHPHVTTLEIDVQETESLAACLQDCTSIVWLVSAAVPSTHFNSLTDDFNLNLQPLIRFLEAAAHLPQLCNFIYLSSGGTIYGDAVDRQPFTEDYASQPISAYGLSKIQAEHYISFLTQHQSFQSFILRPSNVYGPYQNMHKPQGIIGYAFKAIIHDTSIDLYDEGKMTRDFVYVADVAKAIQKCMESALEKGETTIFNIGSQQGFTIREILEKINGITGASIKTILKSSRGFDCNYNVLSIGKIKRLLGWEPQTNLQQGLSQVWEWIKNENK